MRAMILSVLLCFLFFVACKEEKTLEWSHEKAISVLADLRAADSQLRKHYFQDRDSVGQYYLSLVLDIHNISEEELNSQLKIIQNDPYLAKQLEEEVLDYLSEKRNKIQMNNADFKNRAGG